MNLDRRVIVFTVTVACALGLARNHAHAQADQDVTLESDTNVDQADQKEKETCDWGKNRRLGSHTFIDPIFIPSALVNSYIGLQTGVEAIQTPRVPIQTSRRVDLAQVRAAETIDFGLRIIDRLGLFMNLSAGANSSVNRNTLVIRGGNYRLAGRVGAIVKLFQLKGLGTQLSLRGWLGEEGGQVLSFLPLLNQLNAAPVRNTVDAVTGDLGNLLLTPFSTFRWAGQLAVAQPIGRLFSVQAFLGFTFESTTLQPYNLMANKRTNLDLSTTNPELGLALTFDAAALHVPIALLLEYRASFPDTENDLTHASAEFTQQVIALGVYYSGRTDLQFGLTMFGQLGSDPIEQRASDGSTRTSGTPEHVGAELVLRYFW